MELAFLAIRQPDVPGRVLPVVGIFGDPIRGLQIFPLRVYLLPVFCPYRAFAGILQLDDLAALFGGAVCSYEFDLEPGGFAMDIHGIHDLQRLP